MKAAAGRAGHRRYPLAPSDSDSEAEGGAPEPARPAAENALLVWRLSYAFTPFAAAGEPDGVPAAAAPPAGEGDPAPAEPPASHGAAARQDAAAFSAALSAGVPAGGAGA